MCLYPKRILNPKYIPNKKNGGTPPPLLERKFMHVPIGCGNCMECKKQRARGWKIRLTEDIKEHKNAKFVTLTFSNEAYAKLSMEITGVEGYAKDNEIAKLAVKRYRERWRKIYKKSLRHWLTTEIGGNRYENIHLHGFVYADDIQQIKDKWQYGYVFVGDYVGEKSIQYMTKYVHKTDQKHPNYKQIVLTSPGIGRNYTDSPDAKKKVYKGLETDEMYRNRQGYKMAMPTYYKHKIYTEEEREHLWLIKINKEERYVNGIKVKTTNGDESELERLLKWEQEKNIRLGYGKREIDIEKECYEHERRKIKQMEKIKASKWTQTTVKKVYKYLDDDEDQWTGMA